jgi:hypothetical protein
MKTMKMSASLGTLLLAGVMLPGCGGGGGGDAGGAGPSTTPAGIEGTGRKRARGTITGFGSVYVNGVKYETDSATTYSIDDSSGTQGNLRVGQVVTIDASLPASGNPRATSIEYSSDLEGPVASIDTVASTFVVLGQTVIVDGNTSFDDSSLPTGFAGLAGKFVEVSGLRDANGDLVATRIEAKSAQATVEIVGTVAELDAVAKTFKIGGQRVDYSAATLEDGGPAAAAIVEVHGTVNGAGTLVATRVERNGDFKGANGDGAEVEGYVSGYVSTSDFVVNGARVTTTGSTVFEGSGTLGANVFVEVEGAFNASGVLVASKVQFKTGNQSRLSGTIDSVNTGSNTFVALGVSVRVDPLTRFEDQSTAAVRQFTIADLRTGDYIEVVGGQDTNGVTLIATRVERDDPDSDAEIRGQARNVDAGALSLVILGLTVQGDGSTEYRDSSDLPMTAAEFFAAANGRTVKAGGALNGAVFVATEFELEN